MLFQQPFVHRQRSFLDKVVAHLPSGSSYNVVPGWATSCPSAFLLDTRHPSLSMCNASTLLSMLLHAQPVGALFCRYVRSLKRLVLTTSDLARFSTIAVSAPTRVVSSESTASTSAVSASASAPTRSVSTSTVKALSGLSSSNPSSSALSPVFLASKSLGQGRSSRLHLHHVRLAPHGSCSPIIASRSVAAAWSIPYAAGGNATDACH